MKVIFYWGVQLTLKSTVCHISNSVETLLADKHFKNCVTPRTRSQNVHTTHERPEFDFQGDTIV